MIRTFKGYLVVTTHDFKSNFSKYLRLLQKGGFPGIVLCRYDRVVGSFRVCKPVKLPKK